MGCGCAGVERAALTIAAAGDGAKILGPQGKDAVVCYGALTLQDVLARLADRLVEANQAAQDNPDVRAALDGAGDQQDDGTASESGSEGARAGHGRAQSGAEEAPHRSHEPGHARR